jgi:hypothetical protein
LFWTKPYLRDLWSAGTIVRIGPYPGVIVGGFMRDGHMHCEVQLMNDDEIEAEQRYAEDYQFHNFVNWLRAYAGVNGYRIEDLRNAFLVLARLLR